jgi:hypothetical protein
MILTACSMAASSILLIQQASASAFMEIAAMPDALNNPSLSTTISIERWTPG